MTSVLTSNTAREAQCVEALLVAATNLEICWQTHWLTNQIESRPAGTSSPSNSAQILQLIKTMMQIHCWSEKKENLDEYV